MRLMKITDLNELRRQVDSIAELLQIKPYPTIEAILNTDEIAAQEYGPTIDNPLTLWDLHWLKNWTTRGSSITSLRAFPEGPQQVCALLQIADFYF
jgi:hypothetical protein